MRRLESFDTRVASAIPSDTVFAEARKIASWVWPSFEE